MPYHEVPQHMIAFIIVFTVVISQIPTRQYEELTKVLTLYLRPKLFKTNKYQFGINEVKINAITTKPN
jgi:hypothetical protein